MADWITIRQAAELTGYHSEHLREMLRDGKINGQKFGTVWMVDEHSILLYLKMARWSDDGRRGPNSSRVAK